jgi:MFS family permease
VRTSTRQNLRTGITEGILTTPYGVVTMPGAFVLAALITQWFGLEKAVYGFFVSLPFLANAAQTLALPLLAGRTSPKRLTLVMAWVNLFFWFCLILTLPLLPRNSGTQVAVVFTVFLALVSISGALSSVGWIAWVREWIPGRLRGGYLGLRSSAISAGTLVFLGMVMLIFKIQPHSIWPFVWVLSFAAIARFFGLLTLHTIHAPRPTAAIGSSGIASAFRQCLHSPGLPVFILFSAWTNFWIGFSSPFGPVFCFEELGLGPDDFALLTALSTASAVAGWTFWGRIADRSGNIPVLVFGMLLWESSNVLWAVLNPGNSWLLYPMFLWGGFFSVAFFLSSFNLLLNLVPPKNSMAAISIHIGATSAAMGVAPILAGALLEEFLIQRGLGMTVYHTGFFIKSAAVLIGLALLYSIREPGRTRSDSLPDAIRYLARIIAGQAVEILRNLFPTGR